jgi:3-oxoacyl-[acyl-carrier-protein] synthase-3
MKPTSKSSRPTRPSLPRRNASIISTGAYLPKKILTNADLEKIVDTTDEWIFSRTGIRERRIAADNETSSDMGAKAALMALKNAGMSAEKIDLVIVATSTPDTIYPSTACRIQHKIGANRAAAFDLSAACSGFLYGLVVAEQFVASHVYETVLVIGAEKNSGVIDWKDRNTCVLFGDGAGAVIVQNRVHSHGLLATDMGSDGSQTDILSLPAQGPIKMSGKEVYRYAVNAMIESAERCLKKSHLTLDEIRCVIPHQANLRIIASIGEKLKIPQERFYINLDRYGNMSAACIPVALHDASQSGAIQPGDHLLLIAFGGGLTWASAILEW